ncbi:MAG: hypothetical protein IBX55_01625 [Methyloprofundus sp.]|nr:hypothetical protein [Methyloprofundus sp.]
MKTKVRLVETGKNSSLWDFYTETPETAMNQARSKAISMIVGCTGRSLSLTAQKFNPMIQDWVDIGCIKGGFL